MATASCTIHNGQAPPKAGKLQPRGRMPLGDVAGHVDAAEKEGHAARIGALQRRQPVAGLFETDVECLTKPIDIVTHRARLLPEPAIGHQDCSCRIVGEADREQLARGGCAQLWRLPQPG
jgi:hypothetical protein